MSESKEPKGSTAAAAAGGSTTGSRWWELSGEESCRELKVNPDIGLTQQEVNQRLQQFGRNEIPSPPGSSLLALIIEQFKDLLVLILLGAAIVSFLLALLEEGEDRLTAFVEPAVILVILGCNAAVGVIQETNAEKAIEKLKKSEASHAHVIRGGRADEVEAALLVPGDIVVVDIGSKVPADIRIIGPKGVNLLADESALTGESDPAQKHGEVISDKPNAVNQDKRNILFSGTLVVKGRAVGVVVLTGGQTEIGKIGSALVEKDEEAKTPLQQKLDEFGEQLSKVIAAICALVWLINIGHFTDPDHGSWLKGAIYYFKIAVALAVAAIPEGLPAVVTTCLALGTMKMAKKNAIVRSLPSVETLGCTTVICSDKTGTLTTNMMSVQKVLTVGTVRGGPVRFKEFTVSGNSFEPIGTITDSETKAAVEFPCGPEHGLMELGKIASVCNESTLVWKPEEKKYTKTGASTEAALKVFAEKVGLPDPVEHQRLQATRDPSIRTIAASNFWADKYRTRAVLEFDRKRKSMSVFVTGPSGNVLMVKGAPEGEFGVLARCNSIRGANGDVVSMTHGDREQLNARLAGYAREGLRVLALAYTGSVSESDDFKDSDNFARLESGLTFVGFTCMQDPPRTEVAESIRKCHTAHIRVIVITGDNPETATAICREIGVFRRDEDVKDKVFIGADWEQMRVEQKQQAVKTASLFSRVEPKHKQELVKLLQAQGEVVAMTGDGVNDATALKKADIGVAMGSGTDVAREASDMVLQDDNFATIVMAVEEGRAIYANTKQFIRYLISSNIGEVACIFLTAAIGMPEALIPVQLLWVNLVTDGLPATALGFNPPDKDVMTKQPRGRTESIINGWMFFRYIVIGVYVGIGTVGGFIWWFIMSSAGPHVTWAQLTNFHDCNGAFKDGAVPGADSIWHNFRSGAANPCEIFHHDTPSTVSLSVLVMIEMFNALNALSENQSLLRVGPFTNLWVLGACGLSFLLHLFIIHVPFFAGVFHVTPLNAEEWKWVVILSLPVFVLDEILKFVSRQMKEKALVKVARSVEDEEKVEKKTKKDN